MFSIFTPEQRIAPSNRLRIESVGGEMTTGKSPLVLRNKWRVVNAEGQPVEERLHDDRYGAQRRANWLARTPMACDSSEGRNRLMSYERHQMRAFIQISNQFPQTMPNDHGLDHDTRIWVRFFLNDPDASQKELWGHRRVDNLLDPSPYDLSKMLQLLAWGLDGQPVLVMYEVHADRTLHEYGEGVGIETNYWEHRLVELNSRDTELGHKLMNRIRALQYLYSQDQYLKYTGGRHY